jgi:Uma2 family endonuclease
MNTLQPTYLKKTNPWNFFFDTLEKENWSDVFTSTFKRKWNSEIIYPESDGKPMADNTKQYTIIVRIKENLEHLFVDRDDVFIAADLFWYPVQYNNKLKYAPDVMVAFGRPKGDRGSYLQWEENNIAPQVVFEILSPGNTHGEMKKKFKFYQRYGVEEYYVYDPDTIELEGWIRNGNYLKRIQDITGWTSSYLNVTFDISQNDLILYDSEGNKFTSLTEAKCKANLEQQRAEKEQQRAEKEKKRAEKEQQRAEKEKKRAEIEKNRADKAEFRANTEKERADLAWQKIIELEEKVAFLMEQQSK